MCSFHLPTNGPIDKSHHTIIPSLLHQSERADFSPESTRNTQEMRIMCLVTFVLFMFKLISFLTLTRNKKPYEYFVSQFQRTVPLLVFVRRTSHKLSAPLLGGGGSPSSVAPLVFLSTKVFLSDTTPESPHLGFFAGGLALALAFPLLTHMLAHYSDQWASEVSLPHPLPISSSPPLPLMDILLHVFAGERGVANVASTLSLGWSCVITWPLSHPQSSLCDVHYKWEENLSWLHAPHFI